MTASARRRRRSTIIATVTAVVATLAAAGLAVAGGLTLYNSTEGTGTARSTPERSLPDTPTAVLAALDDEGELASMAVLVGSASGTGGTIVTVPVSADASGGGGTERLPIDETFRLDGVASLQGEVEATLGLATDTVEVVDEARLGQLLEPIGPIEVDLATAVAGADGRVIVPAGVRTLEPAQAAAVLTARDAEQPAGDRYSAAVAVWSALAAAAGTGETVAGAAGTPGTIDAALGALLAGPASHRSLSFDSFDADDNPRQTDVVRLDRIEVILTFGQIAPGRMSAPNRALTFRIESPFDEAGAGATSTPAQAAYDAIALIIFAGGNVVSVSTGAGEVPATTQVLVRDDSLLAEVQGIDALVGPVEIGVAEERIAGIDAVIRLGSSFVDHLASTTAPETTAPDETTAEGDD